MTKDEVEKMIKEFREHIDADFVKLTSSEEYKDFDPYKGIDLTKGDGKIQVEMEDFVEAESKSKTSRKLRYFIKRRPEVLGDFRKFFKDFDWKAKGVVRKRYEAVLILPLLRHPYTPKDLKERLHDLIEKCKALEEVVGKLPALRQVVQDHQIKYNFIARPKEYYKDYFKVMNPLGGHSKIQDQIDVRRMPGQYAHRKIGEAIAAKAKET